MWSFLAKSLVAQLDPPGVSNEDVQGSNPIFVIVDYIYKNGNGGFFGSTWEFVECWIPWFFSLSSLGLLMDGAG